MEVSKRRAPSAVLLALLAACSPATLESTSSTSETSNAGPTAAAEQSGGSAAAQGITVQVRPPAPSVTTGDAIAFTADVFGTTDQSVTWSVAEASGGTIDGGHYVSPSVPGTYHVVARSAAQPDAVATATVTVAALSVAAGANPAPAIGSFTASPATVTAGASTTLLWSSSSAASATISPGVGSVAANGSVKVAPATTTTYTLVVTGAGGTASAPLQVTVTPSTPAPPAGAPSIASFGASPASVAPGGSTTLAWSVSGATSVVIDNGVGDVTSAASKPVAPAATTTYTLTARNASGASTAQATVVVSAARADYYASPSGSGTACSSGSPCTLTAALSQLAALGSNAARSGNIVQLAAGDYGTVTLTSSHSGPDANHRVLIQCDPAAPAYSCRFLGGPVLSTWTRVTSSDSGIWARLPSAAKKDATNAYVFRKTVSGVTGYSNASFTDDGRKNCDIDAGSPGSFGGNCASAATAELYVTKVPTGYSCATDHVCPPPVRLARYPNVANGRSQYVASFGGHTAGSSPSPYTNHFDSPYSSSVSAGVADAAEGGFFFNALEQLDQAGEYVIESGVAYLWPLTDADPSATGEVMLGSTANALTFASGSQYIEVRGIAVEGAQTDCVSMGGTGNKLGGTKALPGYVRHCAGNAIVLAGSGHVIDHQVIADTGNDLIAVASDSPGVSVTNNRMADYGRLRTSYVSALRVVSVNMVFEHNVVSDGPWAALYLGGTGFVARYNDISRLPLDGSDNGIYHGYSSSGTPNLSTTFAYNYVHHVPQPSKPGTCWRATAMYGDDRVTGISNIGNVLYCIGACGTFSPWSPVVGQERTGSIGKNAEVYRNNVFVDVDADDSGHGDSAIVDGVGASGGVASPSVANNLFIRSPASGSWGGSYYGTLPQSGTSSFVSTSTTTSSQANNGGIDLSNGSGRFSSSVFTTDANGLDYIPWSQIGIQP